MSGASRPPPVLVWVMLVVTGLLVYAPVRDHPFVVYDDKAWVVENPLVNRGVTGEGLSSVLTTSHQGNWVPLAFLSHMLDVELFGLDPGPHHVVNVLLHLLAAGLLYEALRRMTGAGLRSAFVAAVFALHPTHVESVAWISERRDVLSGVFFALALLAHAGVARARDGRRAWAAALVASLGLGLLAKPMLVTLPVLLLLLDVWPLGRGGLGLRRLLLEKSALWLLAAGAAVAVVLTQREAGAVASFAQVPLVVRLANAALATVAYARTTLLPLELAVFYPLDLDPPLWQSLSAGAGVVLVSALAWQQRHRRPYLAVGWLWFLVMLLPVIGLVQVGSQGRADRYTYLPATGLVLALTWGAAEALAARPGTARAASWAAIAWLTACALLARSQVATWRDSVALFEHARSVVGDHPIVLVNLGEAHDDAGDREAAIALYRSGLEGHPGAHHARLRLGVLLAERGESAEAAAHLREAIRRRPDAPGARLALARLLLAPDPGAARALLERERALDPAHPEVAFRLAEAAAAVGDEETAARAFAEALSAEPGAPPDPVRGGDPDVLTALARALDADGRPDAARRWRRRALVLARLAGDAEGVARLERELSGGGASPRVQ